MRISLILIVGTTILVLPIAVNSKEPPSEEIKKANAGLNSSLNLPTTLEERVRVATWKILLGEFASDPKKSLLFTGAIDLFEEGEKEIEDILKELGKDRNKWLPLARNPAVLARLDTYLVRKEETEKKKETARQGERSRLETLRAMVKTYRDANNAMAVVNTAFQTGDFKTVREKSHQVREMILSIRILAEGKNQRDWYLLFDEPRLDGKSKELKLVDIDSPDILPLGADILDHLNALISFSAYRLAVANSNKPDLELLKEAETTAKEIKSNEPNCIALYTLGNVAKTLGLMETSLDPLNEASHKKAKTYFDNALKLLEDAKKSSRTESSRYLFNKDFDETILKIKSPKWFLEKANQENLAGRPINAINIIAEGQKYHRDPTLAEIMANTQMRIGTRPEDAIKDVEKSIQAKLLAKESRETSLILGRLNLNAASDIIFQPGGAGSGSAKAMELLEKSQILFKNSISTDGGFKNTIADAYLALSQAYKIAIVPNQPILQTQHIYKKALLAANQLKQLADDKTNLSTKLDATEALFACYLAQGMLAPLVLQDYRDESQRALQAAADVQARLPGAVPGVRLSGNAISSAILKRPDASTNRLAIQERMLRLALAKLTRASTSLSLGDSKAALIHAENAFKGSEFASMVEKGNAAVPPEANLDLASTQDATKEVAEIAKIFAILTSVSANEMERALNYALVSQTPSLDTAEKILAMEENPMMIFALVRAFEGYATLQNENKSKWVAMALRAQKQAQSFLLRSPGFVERYPELPTLISDAGNRLSGPDYFLTQAEIYRNGNNFKDASKILYAGLALHPLAYSLNEELLSVELDRAELADTKIADWKKTIKEAGSPKTSRTAMLLGKLCEKTGDLSQAVGFYEKAKQLQPTKDVAVQVDSRIAVLTVLALKK